MKVIDLLNKIANGEEVPKKIKYHWKYEYKYDEDRNEYCYMNNQNERFDDEWFIIAKLNDEVEIIEEVKDIEKLDEWKFNKSESDIPHFELAQKINELIDIVKELKNEK